MWARTKLMIHDDLLKPKPLVDLKYHGPHPERLYKEIPILLTRLFRVQEHSMQEKLYQWSKGDPQKFKVKWEINKDLDKFSYFWIECEISGQSSRGEGVADIVFTGALRTEYPQDTIWQKSLLYEFLSMFWHTTYYVPKRDT